MIHSNVLTSELLKPRKKSTDIMGWAEVGGMGKGRQVYLKSPDSKYFKLVGHEVSVTITHLCCCAMKVVINK